MHRRDLAVATRSRAQLALILLACFATECGRHRGGADSASRFDLQLSAMDSAAAGRMDPNERLATSDPLAFLKMCRDRYVSAVRDYRCTFTKFEPAMGPDAVEQEMRVDFRESPFSVDMTWLRNPERAQRVSYVKGRWSRDGKEYCHIEPSGVLALLAPAGVKRDIHAPEIKAASRRTIDLFGFRNTLDLIIKFADMAQGDPRYAMKYKGTDTLNGRPSYVIERYLPYTLMDQPYPDRLLVIYIDCEWLVPTGCFAYADDERVQLLGSYVTTDVQFNVGLTDADF